MRMPGRMLLLGVGLAVALTAAGAGSAAGAEAVLPRGSWSIGAQAAYAILDMGDLRGVLGAVSGSDYEKLDRAAEGALDVRYALRKEFFLGLEGGYLRGEAEDRTGAREAVAVHGVPLQVIGGATVAHSEDLAARVVAGIGVLFGGLDSGSESLGSGVGLLTCLGAEAEWRAGRGFAVTAQALAREAKVSRPGDLDYDLDFSGGSLRLGVRLYLGGRPE